MKAYYEIRRDKFIPHDEMSPVQWANEYLKLVEQQFKFLGESEEIAEFVEQNFSAEEVSEFKETLKQVFNPST